MICITPDKQGRKHRGISLRNISALQASTPYARQEICDGLTYARIMQSVSRAGQSREALQLGLLRASGLHRAGLDWFGCQPLQSIALSDIVSA